MSVAEQIDFSLTTLDRLLDELGWRAAADDINVIISRAFPRDSHATVEWWGGIWLGASLHLLPQESHPTADLRMYLNLRHGSSEVRWRRIGEILGCFARPAMIGYLCQWVESVSPLAIPVGLGVVVAEARVVGIRVYLGVAEPRATRWVAECGLPSLDTAVLEQALAGFVGRFGAIPPQAVTVGYDFVRDDDGRFQLEIGRTKVDFCCQMLPRERHKDVGAWCRGIFALWPQGPQTLDSFLEDMEAVWGGHEIQFLSLGFTPELNHATLYAKPQ